MRPTDDDWCAGHDMGRAHVLPPGSELALIESQGTTPRGDAHHRWPHTASDFVPVAHVTEWHPALSTDEHEGSVPPTGRPGEVRR